MIKSSRAFVVSLFISAAFITVGCGELFKTDQDSEVSSVGLKSGISTEHPIDGVNKTACSFTKQDVINMKNKGYYYGAVPESIFKGGKNCGRILTVTVAGACYENHSAACTTENGNASVVELAKASGQKAPSRTVNLYIADSCGSCLNDPKTPHIDISSLALRNDGRLAPIVKFMENNIQKVKQYGSGKTGQPNNLFLKSITMRGCAPGLKFESWVAKGYCNK